MTRRDSSRNPAVRLSVIGLTLLVALAVSGPGRADAPRTIVIGEVSGAANSVTQLLQRMQLVDEAGHWIGGDAVFVQTGDLMDGGENVRAALDLFMRLQEEAAAAGGKVVVLMGNHEVLNIIGDYRGVDYMAYQHFAGADSEVQQQQAWEAYAAWREQRAEATGGDFTADETAKSDWMANHPPGWVEYAMSMRPEGVYGRWLRTLPVAFEHDGTLYVHAGFSPEMGEMDVAYVNDAATDEIAAFDDYRARMVTDGLALPFSSAHDLVDVITAEIAYINDLKGKQQRSARKRAEAANELQPLTRLGNWVVLAKQGPLWFKGATEWDDKDHGSEMVEILDGLGARRMVVGHASGPAQHIHARFGGRVIVASCPMSDDPWVASTPAGLEIIGDDVFVVTPTDRQALLDAALDPTLNVARR